MKTKLVTLIITLILVKHASSPVGTHTFRDIFLGDTPQT